jgi:drug/metabolite transporter (DMT)-like permease
MAEFNKCLLYLLILLMILTGSINTIFNKILQKLSGCGLLFEGHHWIITYGMFCGELVSIFFYAYIVYKRKHPPNQNNQALIEGQRNGEEEGETEQSPRDQEEEENKQRPPVPTNLIFAITALCDLIATTINTFGLTYLATSMFQMMRGLELFFVCLWSKIFLKNPVYRHAILGIGSLIFGLSLVGLNSIMHDDENRDNAKNPIIGIILLCSGQLFTSTEYVFQELFIKRYEVHPFQLVGFEGLWGAIMYTILLIIFQLISCDSWTKSFKEGICSENDKHEFHIEDTLFAFKQMKDNIKILIVYIFYVASIALHNIVGINLTKLVSSTARAVVDTVRTVFIWLFFLCFEPVKGTHEHFYYLQLIGFCFLVLGTLIYNEIVTIPYFGLDYYTRDNISKRKKKNKNKGINMDDKGNKDDEGKLYKSIDGKESSASQDQDNLPAANEQNENP